MAHYKVILAYDGTEYAGFQRQANAKTVQGVVEKALRRIGWNENSLLAAGRTDRGVHARGQVISFQLEWAHQDTDLLSAINANLPADISAQEVSKVEMDFHPRKNAVTRHYRYHLICYPQRQPLDERYAWRVWPPVEMGVLQDAASAVVGTHDFKAYGNPPNPGQHTVRRVELANWNGNEVRLAFDIISEAFLYHMVRRLVFVMVAIARGKITNETFLDSIYGGQNLEYAGIAPPNGLVLVGVEF